ncbi:hypothetical protein D9Q98_001091 [Chlorella vulgaris]|uniref:Uncharacterized protein n=1 Tax=Chlorella vulgaris TaxID=3077 RepID=A0A9D4Z294_CHLVU|nr:hypothetical protein D9Q98_001091 [Chlorella vulgaris]
MPAVAVKPAHRHITVVSSGRHPKGNPGDGAPPSFFRRRLASAVPLLFLPWRGCDQGGNYSTGVKGPCQPIYQPAAAAEERYIKQQQQQQQRHAEAATATSTEAGPPSPAPSNREDRSTLMKEQAAYERVAMEAEQQRRTQQLVDSMWQGLE